MAYNFLSAVANPVIKSFVDNVITPKIKKFAKKCDIAYNDLLIPRGEHFEKYLNRMYEKNSTINTLVFHNSQRQLKDVYVAQSLVKKNYYIGGIGDSTKIDRLPVELIKEYKKILIKDTAGMGKSTIMKYMFIDLIDNRIKDVGIPIYIELNKLNKDRTILKEIQEELSSLSDEFDTDLLLNFIQKGDFIFFLDGFDETAIADRTKVTKDIQTFISKAGTKNYYILTSRPDGNLPSFGDFQLFRINPLKNEEAYDLLKKYDMGKKKELSKRLIELLKSGQYKTLDEYLANPLLVSLLFTAYDFNGSIPFEKHRFYEVVFGAYFEKHDSSKPIKPRDKRSGLKYDGFDRILRYVGYDCLVRTGVKFNEDAILNSIRRARDFCGNLVFSETDFLKDLTSSVPLFCKDGTDYKWVHKSLLEYFAARFIFCDAKQNQDKILTAIYTSDHIDKFFNMLDLYYDIDIKGFSKNITLPLFNKYIEFYDNLWFDSDINDDLIKERIGNMFGGDVAFILTESYDIWESSAFSILSDVFTGKDAFVDQKILGANIVITSAGRDKNVNTLLHLLYDKKPSFFKVMQNYYIPKKIFKKYGFCFDKVFAINERTGEADAMSYDICNIVLSRNYYLDYEACKIEVKRITSEIESVDSFLIEDI